MSHELTESDSMLSAEDADGRKTWHARLGTPVNFVEGEVTVEEAPELAGLGWLTEHETLFTATVDGINADGTPHYTYTEVPDARGVVRVDNGAYLGTVGTQHTLVQNQELFDLAAALQAEGHGAVMVETAGSLKGNRLVWVLAKLDRDLLVNGDRHFPYLLIANSHDGSMALRVQTTLTRVVCWNTLSYAIRGQQQSWTARHSTGIGERVGEIQHALGLSFAYVDEWEADVRRMMDTPARPREFDKFVERLVPIVPNPTDRQVRVVEGKRAEVRQLHEGPTVGEFKGTAWGAFQAGTEWDQWKRPVQGATRSERLGDRAVTGSLAADTTHIRNLLTQSVPELAA